MYSIYLFINQQRRHLPEIWTFLWKDGQTDRQTLWFSLPKYLPMYADKNTMVTHNITLFNRFISSIRAQVFFMEMFVLYINSKLNIGNIIKQIISCVKVLCLMGWLVRLAKKTRNRREHIN